MQMASFRMRSPSKYFKLRSRHRQRISIIQLQAVTLVSLYRFYLYFDADGHITPEPYFAIISAEASARLALDALTECQRFKAARPRHVRATKRR